MYFTIKVTPRLNLFDNRAEFIDQIPCTILLVKIQGDSKFAVKLQSLSFIRLTKIKIEHDLCLFLRCFFEAIASVFETSL